MYRRALEITEYTVSLFLCISFLLIDFYRVIYTVLNNGTDYKDFCIPEMMINYQGRFVRRGILGEIMYQAFLIHPYPFHSFLIFTEAFFFIVFIILSFYVFNKLKSIPIAPFAIIVGGLIGYRRDFLIIIIAFLVFHTVIQYVKYHKSNHRILLVGTMILAILIYEPSFFFIVPISMLIYYQNNYITRCYSKRLMDTFLTFCLPVITMAIVCSAKGTSFQAQSIWQSWAPLFDYLNMQQPRIPAAIQFLSRSEHVDSIAMMHLNINYGIGCGCKLGFNPLLVGGSLLFFCGAYFLTITIPQKLFSHGKTMLISSTFIIQCICLLPMFTILSCDFGRTILYVMFTSYYLTYLVLKHEIILTVKPIDFISEKMACCLTQISTHKLFLLHIITLALIPFRIWNGISITDALFINEFYPKIVLVLSKIGL